MRKAAIALVLMTATAHAERDPLGELIQSAVRSNAGVHVDRAHGELDKATVDFCASLALDPNRDASDGLEGSHVVALSASCAPAMKGMLPDVTVPAERMLPPLANDGFSARALGIR